MDYFIGIDIGGTGSRGVIADQFGNILSFIKHGPANARKNISQTVERIEYLISRLCTEACIPMNKVKIAGCGISGYDWPSQDNEIQLAIARLQFPFQVEICNDTLIALHAGTFGGYGVSLISGTHCNCRGWMPDGRMGRVTGAGFKMGEAAGAAELVTKAINEVSRQWNRTGTATLLSERFIRQTGANDLDDLIEGLVMNRYQLNAKDALVIFELAIEKDPVSVRLIEWLNVQLYELALAVFIQLDLQQDKFDMVLSGSMFNWPRSIYSKLVNKLKKSAPNCNLIWLTAPPVIGGVVLGMIKCNCWKTQYATRLVETALDRSACFFSNNANT